MQKKKNVIEKLRKFFHDLTPSERSEAWDIMSALRSLDIVTKKQYPLKDYTTARLRYSAFRSDALLITRSSPPVFDKKELKQAQKAWRKASPHWKEHFKDAMYAIRCHCPDELSDVLDFIKKAKKKQEEQVKARKNPELKEYRLNLLRAYMMPDFTGKEVNYA